MPVYNAEQYVSEAIQSILNQTFKDFEFIIIDDCSIDNSLEVMESFNDKRIIILKNAMNVGNYPSRNKGLNIARGKYICVMDADDVAVGIRLERQYYFMENHAEIGIAGSGFRYYGSEKDNFRESDNEKLKVLLLRNNYFIHPTIIIRTDILRTNHLTYDERYRYSADYDLIVQSSTFSGITNIPEVLLLYRQHEQQVTSQHRQEQINYADKIAIKQLKFFNIDPDEIEKYIHLRLLKGIPIKFNESGKCLKWIEKILNANIKRGYFNQSYLEDFIRSLLSLQPYCFFSTTKRGTSKPIKSVPKYDMSDFTILIPVRIDSQLRFENLNTICNYIMAHFKSNILILEADKEQYYHTADSNINHVFIKDDSEIYNKTTWVNKLMNLSETDLVIIWDADVIVPDEQIEDCSARLRTGNFSMCIPYDGRAFNVDSNLSSLFRDNPSIELLKYNMSALNLMHGYNMVGGIYMVSRNYFLMYGGENEKIIGWGLEDADRLKRMEASGLPVYFSKGPLFHLFHPRGSNSCFNNREIERKNRLEFIRTCTSL